MGRLFLGIDTSNYTTSVSLYSPGVGVIANIKIPLPVEEGKRGLRQSDAVFSHIKNAPRAAEILKQHLSSAEGEITAVGFSASPRRETGSYMPCFLVGEAIARFIASSNDVTVYPLSHQEGHVAAAAYSACGTYGSDLESFFCHPFLSFHVSGGTFDLLYVEPDEENIISIRRVGGTKDACAGQIIDRTGVRMGMSFPCGVEMDALACGFDGTVKHDRICVQGLDCNISGLENKAEDLLENGVFKDEVSAYVLEHIARTVRKLTENAKNTYGDVPVLFAGGVMSSRFIKSRLEDLGMFASPEFSSDNAAGIAVLTSLLFRKEHNGT